MAEALFLAAPSQQAALEAPGEHSLILTAAESELRQELSGLPVSSVSRHCSSLSGSCLAYWSSEGSGRDITSLGRSLCAPESWLQCFYCGGGAICKPVAWSDAPAGSGIACRSSFHDSMSFKFNCAGAVPARASHAASPALALACRAAAAAYDDQCGLMCRQGHTSLRILAPAPARASSAAGIAPALAGRASAGTP